MGDDTVREITLEEEILDNARTDRLTLKKFITSAIECLNRTSDEKGIHEDIGDVISKYHQSLVKNNEQLIEILKIRKKRNINSNKVSKEDIENKFGNDLKAYANKHHLDYNTILDEEAIKNLYSYQYVFNI